MKILIVGDVHNNFGQLNSLINNKRPDLIICCGEFGYWPRAKNTEPIERINTHGAKLLWIDGNHEDFWSLEKRSGNEVAPNVWYMPRGSTYTLDDGRAILFMGGANSIDKDIRTIGIDWFPEEIIRQSDFLYLPDKDIDIFITHTCPRELVKELSLWNGEEVDPSTFALSELYKMYQPSLWYFSHWHCYRKGELGNMKWTALSMMGGSGRYWCWLPEGE